MKFDKKEKIDYEKVLNFIGFKKLDSFDKKTMTMLLQKGPLSLFYKNYPNTIKDSTIVATDFQVIYFLTEIFKYQLETSTKCDKLIDQNSKVIEQ